VPRLRHPHPRRVRERGRAGEGPLRGREERLLRAYVWLVAAHSLAIGAALALAPDLATRLAGFGPVEPVFFARQAGAFHLALGLGYLLEIRRGSVTLLLAAKGVATAFLGWSVLAGGAPWSVPVSGAADALMALGALWLHRRARAAGRAPRAP
jgi:hypothetical protein